MIEMIFGVLIGLVLLGLGVMIGRVSMKPKISTLTQEKQTLQQITEEKISAFREAQSQFEKSFENLSSRALQQNNESFLQLAKSQLEKYQDMAVQNLNQKEEKIHGMVKPVQESLQRVDQKLQDFEKSRIQVESGLQQQLRSMIDTHQNLQKETSNLVAALRAPQTRGQWGEMQLKRVVEMSGMLEHCNFLTQSKTDDSESRLRPDLVVKLPGGKSIVVDAKTPLNSYLDAMQTDIPEQKKLKYMEHARHLRKHIDDLSRKAYWSQFEQSPEFVVLFLPNESMFGAALEADPSLIESGVRQNVILATPTTLIALLKAASYGWQQQAMSENLREVSQVGQELYKRLGDMTDYFDKLGKNLNQSVDAYNRLIGNVESRVMVSARKLGAQFSKNSDTTLKPIAPLSQQSRSLQGRATELGTSMDVE